MYVATVETLPLMGKIADALALVLACTTANASVNYSRYVPGCRSRYLEIPHCPDGKNADTLASILACKTTVDALVNYRLCVPQRLKHFSHRPDGKVADVLAPTHACTTTSVNYRGCVPQRPCKVPIAPMGKCLVDMSISILIFYDGCCLDLPGWSTCHLRLKLQKFPSPRWEKCSRACFDSRLHNCGQRFCHLQYVRAAEDLENFPSPRWENC